MVKIVVDRQEVLALIDLIEAPHAAVESKLKAIKRLETITGRDITGTKEFRKIRDEYLSGGDKVDGHAAKVPSTAPETHVERKTRRD